jgi:HAD superfamily hydrolase (TIGR01450 family)
MRSLDILRQYDVVLCDIDGVLHVGPKDIVGVPELLHEVTAGGTRVYFLTNNGTHLPEQIVRNLGKRHLPIDLPNLITAGQVLEDEFDRQDLVGKPILSIGNAAAEEYIRRAGGEPIPSAEARARYGEAGAVVVGSSRELDKDVIDASCNAVYRHHVPVICTNPDVFTPVGDGEITLVAGALARLFERELGVEVHWLGKPHPPIFKRALRQVRDDTGLQNPRVLMIDDNVESGILGGARMGFDTMLVLSGWHRSRAEADAALARRDLQPTWILDSIVGSG